MKNSISCHHVADFFLLQMDQNAGDIISNLKLQKLCYYAQAWHAAITGDPLFGEKVKAWAHGPVVPELYHRFKKYRWDAIQPSDVQTDPYEDLPDEHLELLSEIWAKYGTLTAKQLEDLSHSETPWRRAYGDTPLGDSCDEEISVDSMRQFYGAKSTVLA